MADQLTPQGQEEDGAARIAEAVQVPLVGGVLVVELVVLPASPLPRE